MKEDLQFERAEFAGGAPPAACAFCGQAIQGTYFQVADRVACEKCRWDAERQTVGGSAPRRFLKATGLGLIAAVLGSALYYAVGALTGYEFGLIAIVVGLMVGGAVRHGAERRGGWPYQLLAMALTYLSIVGNHVPEVVAALRQSGGDNIVVLVVLGAVVCLAAPFLGGFEGILGIIIIGIGLYEAWKMNRKVPLTISGPFQIAPAAAPVPAAES